MSGKEIHTKATFQVLGMSCAVCALNVETTLGAQEGVYEAKEHVEPDGVELCE